MFFINISMWYWDLTPGFFDYVRFRRLWYCCFETDDKNWGGNHNLNHPRKKKSRKNRYDN